MKKDKFWKIMAVIFLTWLFLFLWNSSIYISRTASGRSMKFNKLTGAIYIIGEDGTWFSFKKEMSERQY